jgi:hypothetical protein
VLLDSSCDGQLPVGFFLWQYVSVLLAIRWRDIMPPRDGILADILTSPEEAEPFLTRVKKVVVAHAPNNGNLVDDALGNTVWGEIRWSRSLGWPIAARMADGFSVRFQHLVVNGEVGPGGVLINTSEIVEGATPSLWDGPHDEENFRVSFLFHGVRPWRHQAVVELKSAIKWGGTSPWWLPPARRIRYPASLPGDGTFHLQTIGPTFLDEFLVVNAFY